jgi:hypothetical protein
MRTDANPWLTPDELADELRLPVGTIYGWRYRGLGPVGHRIGRHVRYHRNDVDSWIDTQRDARATA